MSANFADMEFVTLAKDGTEGYFPEIWVKKCFLCFEVLSEISESFGKIFENFFRPEVSQ